MQRYDATRRTAIAVIESLRAGIPTRLTTRELPDLRASLTQTIQKDLSQFAAGKRPAGRLAWGPYGQGKTHTLTTVEHVALDLGFAVSRVCLSREVSCHHLFNFYSRVAPVIRIPDSKSYGLTHPLSRKTATDLHRSPIVEPNRYVHPLPALILEDYFYTGGEEQELLYGDLSGTRLPVTDLKRIHRACRGEALPRFPANFRATEHGQAYFGMMADAIVMCGYKGWVLLIDEVELVGRLGKLGRLQAYQHLDWLLNWSGTLPYPIYTLGVVASSLRNDVWFRSTHTPNASNDRTQIPELASARNGSEAGEVMQRFFDQAISPHCPTIKPLDHKDLLKLLEKVAEFHGLAYGWDPALSLSDLLASLGSQPIRTHIRATLEALDMAYVYQAPLQLEVAPLTEASVTEDEEFLVSPTEES